MKVTPIKIMQISTLTLSLFVSLSGLSILPSVMAEQTAKPSVVAEPAKPKAKVKPYTLETCIVTDDKLGEMGKPVVFTYKDQEIKLCCKACRKDFDKDPSKYLKKLETKG